MGGTCISKLDVPSISHGVVVSSLLTVSYQVPREASFHSCGSAGKSIAFCSKRSLVWSFRKLYQSCPDCSMFSLDLITQLVLSRQRCSSLIALPELILIYLEMIRQSKTLQQRSICDRISGIFYDRRWRGRRRCRFGRDRWFNLGRSFNLRRNFNLRGNEFWDSRYFQFVNWGWFGNN